ncbi:MAG: cysteine desulfurase [Bacteroidetes bacterium]|nr:cysteine desulfurase [Bacteroidota bacterium]
MNDSIRAQFPILHQTVKGRPLIYLDNAATSQKPLAVIQAIDDYYRQYNSNIHRGAHHLAQMATEQYEAARQTVADHINASVREINFVRGTTEAVNLVANAYGRKFIQAGDEIIVSEMEHHSNIVPWQMLCEEKGATLRVIPITDSGELVQEAYLAMLSPKTKLVAVAHTSNALGTIHPVKEMIAAAHAVGAVVFIDGAQALPHTSIDVQDLDCDFLGFSGHKVFAGTGIGVLYGKAALLEQMNPYMGGGEMIKTVSFRGTTYNDLPYKFEAGTPHIEGGISLGAALKYVQSIGLPVIAAYENELLQYATQAIQAVPGIQLVGTAAQKASVLSFLIGGIHPYDVGVLLNEQGIAIRTGHHCCQPLMERFGIEGTCRASFAFYNTRAEVDVLVQALQRAVKILS